MASTPWVDRRGAKRTVEMQVLVLGFPRTGTTSIQAALRLLGYHDIHHMRSMYENPAEADMWVEAINARFFGRGTPYGRAEWDQLLGHCQAVTDAPSMLFSADLIAAYPEAMVVLQNRNIDKWWMSYVGSIGTLHTNLGFRLAQVLDPALRKFVSAQRLVLSALLGPVVTEEGAKARFTDHYNGVRMLVPKERLLEYDVKDGWGPLCAFLGKDVPAGEFPRMNDTQVFTGRCSLNWRSLGYICEVCLINYDVYGICEHFTA
ncbi:hypothetical protein B0H17DRAFT_1161218 [Mycena rosella]|uniref:P-loop containing nucleoside triphosphate hydrolase protein n=1 Tax=Mycena rosella TaxID=1033263 RepID=A0AAD7D904_MYCRO|nr:hypothetical protein B0H17DRAFT_1161218 [Mycena rosella]